MDIGNSYNVQSSVLAKLTEHERAMHSYRPLINLKSLPLSHVTDQEFRNFSKHNIIFGVRTFKETMFKLVEIVEAKIKDEMTLAKGAVMYDEWTHNSTHYIGVFAVYTRTLAVFKNGVISSESELAMPLLAVSPMASREGKNDNDAAVCEKASPASAMATPGI